MEAIVCSINSKYIHSSLAPWCLMGGIKEYAPEVKCRIIEATINEREEDVFQRICKEKFEIIGFCTYIWNFEYVKSLCKRIKKELNVKVVLGGPEVSYNANEILMESYADYVISGEGELPFAMLCRGDNLNEIPGLCYKQDGVIQIAEPYISCDEPPSPYVAEYFEKLNGRIAYIETSRGCPFRCAFCLSGRCGGVRFFDLERSKKNIVALANSGAKTVKFIDRSFNANIERAKDIFRFIIENYGKNLPRGVCFHFEIEGELIDEETIEILKKAPIGSIQLEIGIQSFNEKTLENINRRSNLERLCKNIRRLVELSNIHIHIDLIAGLPYENMESFENSFNKAYFLGAHMLQFGFLKLLYGSDMRENKEKYPCEFSKVAPYEVISTPWLSAEEMKKLHTCEEIFDKIYNTGRFTRTYRLLVDILKNPFKVFLEFSGYIFARKISIRTLDELAEAIFLYFTNEKGIEIGKLRDAMAMDRLATNRMGTLPEFLKIKTELTKKALNFLENDSKTRKKKGVKRALTVLSSMKKAVYVDYDFQNPVTKQFNLCEFDIENI